MLRSPHHPRSASGRLGGGIVWSALVLATGAFSQLVPAEARAQTGGRTSLERLFDLRASGLDIWSGTAAPFATHTTGVSWSGPRLPIFGDIACAFKICFGNAISIGARGNLSHDIRLQASGGTVDVAYPMRATFTVPDQAAVRSAVASGAPVRFDASWDLDAAARLRTRLPYVDVTSSFSVAQDAYIRGDLCFIACASVEKTLASWQTASVGTPSVAWVYEGVDRLVNSATVKASEFGIDLRVRVRPCFISGVLVPGGQAGPPYDSFASFQLCSPTLATEGGRSLLFPKRLSSSGAADDVIKLDVDVDELVAWKLTGDQSPDYFTGTEVLGPFTVDYDVFTGTFGYALGIGQSFSFRDVTPVVRLDFSSAVLGPGGGPTRHLEFPLSAPWLGPGIGGISFTPMPGTELLSVTPTVALSGMLRNVTSASLRETLSADALHVKVSAFGRWWADSFYSETASMDETIPLYSGGSRVTMLRTGASIGLLTPEPSTSLLVATFLAGMAAVARRRREV